MRWIVKGAVAFGLGYLFFWLSPFVLGFLLGIGSALGLPDWEPGGGRIMILQAVIGMWALAYLLLDHLDEKGYLERFEIQSS